MHKTLAFTNIWTKKKIVGTLFVFFFLIASIIALVTYYGLNVGSFTISIAEDLSSKEIFISKSSNPEEITDSRLVCKSLTYAQPQALTSIKTSYVRTFGSSKENNGVYGEYIPNNNTYIGYTYFIKNNSNETVTIDVSMNIESPNNKANEVIWVWYFAQSTSQTSYEADSTEEKLANGGIIYHKKDSKESSLSSDQYQNYKEDGYNIEEFLDSSTVFSSRRSSETNTKNASIITLKKQEVYKCTIILWVEQFDPDGEGDTSDLIGEKAKFNIQYTLHSSEEEIYE